MLKRVELPLFEELINVLNQGVGLTPGGQGSRIVSAGVERCRSYGCERR